MPPSTKMLPLPDLVTPPRYRMTGMFLEGTIFRNGYKGLNLDQATFEREMPIHLGHPNDERVLGNAYVGRGADGDLWVQFTISELDTQFCADNPFFAASISFTDDEGGFKIETISISAENEDTDIKPYVGY